MGGDTLCRETQTRQERNKGRSSKKEENFKYDLIIITNLLVWSLTFQKCTSNKVANLVFIVNNVFFFQSL